MQIFSEDRSGYRRTSTLNRDATKQSGWRTAHAVNTDFSGSLTIECGYRLIGIEVSERIRATSASDRALCIRISVPKILIKELCIGIRALRCSASGRSYRGSVRDNETGLRS